MQRVTAFWSKSNAALGVFAILLATACWSSGGVLVKHADQPGVVVAFWRLVIVAGVFGLLALARRRPMSWTMVRRSVPGGLLFGVNLAVWFDALRYATVGMVTVLAALVPVMTLVVGNRFFGETIRPIAIGCAAAAIAGVVLFIVPTFDTAGGATRGLIMAFLGVVLWVAYLYASKRARAGVGTVEYLLCMAIVAGLSLVPFMVLFTDEGLALPTRGWGWIIAIALVPGTIGHGLLAWAQPHVPMSTAGILLQAEPVLASIAGALFLGEAFGVVQGLGLAVTFTALAVLTWASTADEPVVVAD